MIDLKELYSLQASLDAEIANNHHITYETTFERRLLALIVEIGELANETRCFKYWSNKGSSPKEVVMDEFADGIHFLLSLGIPLHANKYLYEIKKSDLDLTRQIHEVYKAAVTLLDHYDLKHYEDAFQKYLNLSASIGMSEEDVINSYKAKLKVNHVRQETNY
jgi:dimeric dUTPase (all-alpha-NTP-PPase superfamily)